MSEPEHLIPAAHKSVAFSFVSVLVQDVGLRLRSYHVEPAPYSDSSHCARRKPDDESLAVERTRKK